jgi:cytoskeletal protein CcmA (bactofilin family)
MFARSSSAGPKTLEPRTPDFNRTGPQGRAGAPEKGTKSVIGNDLKIIGQGLKIISGGVLQVDGEIEGDVRGDEVTVGEQGRVAGMVAGQQVVVRGKISGVICGRSIILQASSKVQGDIHHMSLAIEHGAVFDGRSYRATNESQLNSVVDGKSGAQPIVG